MFSEDLFLTNDTGKRLYHDYAKNMPIIDYHCHLLPQEICENKVFEDLGEMWLAHDHYKWRAMRTFGIDEKYITGDSSFYEKYMAFAKIVPQLVGNPIYIWCALELKRYFGIDEPLDEESAERIYMTTKNLIVEKQMTPRWCMEVSNVEVASTTEDPTDSLEYHLKMQKDPLVKVKILSAFRPDKAFYCEKPGFGSYVSKLGALADIEIKTFTDVLAALENRLVFFKKVDTMISDIGIEEFRWMDATPDELDGIVEKAAKGNVLTQTEIFQYRSAFMRGMGEVYHRHGFVMQLHIGTYQGANKSKEVSIGASTGFDCTDDSTDIKSVGELLDQLVKKDTLPKTILYPLNAGQIETFAILAAAFCEGGTRAKVQLGAPWWFNDQAYGINRQFEAIANLYPISLSVGMLTDSRSFLSYPRHELYRRVLCSYLGTLVERGEYFSGETQLKKIVQNICYYNAKEYFGL
jgi:glucuronate isomerase